ncbi:MAG: hypothetical protein IPM21_13220 [Acidobacteria bacterium]|nr:hypothetical protein [Acidobacteriota bacterium]
MRKRLGIMAALAVGGALFIGAADVSAQGRGNGKGRGGEKGGGKQARAEQQQKRGDREARGQQRRSDDEGRRKQAESDRSSRDQQRRSDMEARRQQAQSDQNSRQQQRQSDWESRRQQEWSDRQSRQQQRRSDEQSRRQQEWSDRQNRGRGDERRRSARTSNGTPYWANRNYERPQENRVRQEIRREQKDYEKAERRYEKEYRKAVKERNREYRQVIRRDRQRDYRRERRIPQIWAGRTTWAGPQTWTNQPIDRSRGYDYDRQNGYYETRQYPQGVIDDRYYYEDDRYNDNYYGDDYYGDDYNNNGGNWKDILLRTVLSAFLGGQGFDSAMPYNSQPEYANYQGYASPVFADNNYQQAYYDDAGYYGGNEQSGSQYGPMIVGLADQFSGGYVSDLLARTLATGYYQGLMEGQNARQQGIYDEYYTEPYAYAGDDYSMCSVSLGERRQLMAEGYELGYRDALLSEQSQGGYQETPAYFDLVSLALGNVL